MTEPSLKVGKSVFDAKQLADIRREAERIAREIPDELISLWESHPEEHLIENLDLVRDRCDHPDCASVHTPHNFLK
jgi:hypothetical protein